MKKRKLSIFAGIAALLAVVIFLYAQSTLNYAAPGGSAWYIRGALNISSGGTLNVLSGSSFLTTSGIGAPVANKCTVVESGEGIYHKTVITFTLTGATHDLDLADGDHGTGIKVYDFPEGYLTIVGGTLDGTVVTVGTYNATANDIFYVGIGTAVGADDNTLAATEQDIIASTTMDTDSNAVKTFAWHSQIIALTAWDGTTTAKDLYVNAAINAGCQTTATTYAITGTLTLYWINLGDY